MNPTKSCKSERHDGKDPSFLKFLKDQNSKWLHIPPVGEVMNADELASNLRCCVSSPPIIFFWELTSRHGTFGIPLQRAYTRLTGWKSRQTHSNLKAHFLAFQRISYLNSDCLQEWQKGWKKKIQGKIGEEFKFHLECLLHSNLQWRIGD